MAYCGPAGVPYSAFMEWSALDRALAVEWRSRESSRCSGCGIPYGDWYLDDGTPDDTAYTPELYRCPGCEQLGYVEIEKDDHGLKKRLVPNWMSLRWRNYGRR